ncbi:MAG: 6,7-dimethyl-8-ribityllumazine synthase [Saprospiraceae bacterium]
MAGKLPAVKSKLRFSLELNADHRIGILVSEWHSDITKSLLNAALKVFEQNGLSKQLITIHVPGSFELPLAASWLLKKKKIGGAICLGCVIQGETKHDDYINHTIAQSISNLCLKFDKPLIYGVITSNNLQQAKDRSGGKFGNKGEESAIALLKMLQIKSIVKSI